LPTSRSLLPSIHDDRPPPAGRVDARADGGFVTIEWVLVFPAVLLVVFLGVQYGVWANYKEIAVAAAQDAATDFASRGVPDDAGATAAVDTYLDAYGGAELTDVDVTVAVAHDAAGLADTVTVTVTGSAPAVFDAASLPIRARATVPIERFRP
jgi:Flp pilus assembly protein TadG